MPANTTAIANAIASIISALQIGGQPAYKTVQIGVLKDITDSVPAMEITALSDETERASMAAPGGLAMVQDQQSFTLTSTIDESTSETAETTAYALRDLLTAAFHDQTTLGGVANVRGVYLNHGSKGRYAYALRNGLWYRTHAIQLTVWTTYDTTMEA